MGRRVIKVRRPEGGDERNVVWHEHHNCSQAKALRKALDEPDLDLVQFPVGLAGWEMPLGIPFAVVSTTECKACGTLVGVWVEWTGMSVIEPKRTSALWTP